MLELPPAYGKQNSRTVASGLAGLATVQRGFVCAVERDCGRGMPVTFPGTCGLRRSGHRGPARCAGEGAQGRSAVPASDLPAAGGPAIAASRVGAAAQLDETLGDPHDALADGAFVGAEADAEALCTVAAHGGVRR